MSVSSLSSSSSRIRSAGLVSGLDTEEIVKQMSSLSKQRLNTQKQKLQTLQWKQAEYRKSTAALQEFKNSYFNLLKLMRCSETIKEVKEWYSAFNR